MGMTMAEKILSRHSGGGRVRPGDIVVCDVDKIVQIDLTFAATAPMPKRIADPTKSSSSSTTQFLRPRLPTQRGSRSRAGSSSSLASRSSMMSVVAVSAIR